MIRDVDVRLNVETAMRHAFFSDNAGATNWAKVLRREYVPPILPPRGIHDDEAGIEDLEEMEIFSTAARARAQSLSSPLSPRSRIVSWHTTSTLTAEDSQR